MKIANLQPLFLFGFLLILCSCSKNEDIPHSSSESESVDFYDKEYIRTASLDVQLDYRSFHLTQVVNGLISSGTDFEELFSKGIDKGKSSDKVFVRDLIYSDAIDNKGGVVDKEVQYSLTAFDGLSEENLAPYIEKIKDGDNSNPLFLISTYDTQIEKEIVVGYEISSDNVLELIEGEILEEDIFGSDSGKAETTNSVYTINAENICENYLKTVCPGETTGDTGGTTSPPVSQRRSLKIETMKIKDKKESWLEKADVQIYGLFFPYSSSTCEEDAVVCPTGRRPFTEAIDVWYPNNSYTVNRLDLNEYLLEKYSNSDVNNGRFKTINHHLMYDENLTKDESTEYFAYIIYEYDGWPAPRKAVRFSTHTGDNVDMPFRSYNEKYHFSPIVTRANSEFSWAPEFNSIRPFGSRINNNTIEFTFSPQN